MKENKEIVARIMKRYPFAARALKETVSPLQVDREFGQHGSYCKGEYRVHCFTDEATRNKFKEKYGLKTL